MTQIQNNQKFIGKSKPACIFKISKKSANQKSQGFCQIFTVSNKKCLGQGMDLKICRKLENYRRAYGFLFFVIFHSGDHLQGLNEVSRTVTTKEVNKEQPSYRNLSGTATRVLQCTCSVAASRKYFSAIHTSPHLTSTHLTPDYANTIILHLVSVLYTAVSDQNKN